MKKSYVKPEVTEISVQPNQAVAACGIKITGYENSWARGTGGAYGHPTTEAAWTAYSQHASYQYSNTPRDGQPYVYPIVYGETVDANGQVLAGMFNDVNCNGIMDNGEYIAWQEGNYYQDIVDMLASGSAPVNS